VLFDVDRFLDDVLLSPADKPVWVPACNAYEDEQGFWIQAALPGMDRRDIHLVMKDGVLTIKGVWKQEESNLKRIYVTREFRSGVFSRAFRIPTSVDAEKISATYKNGILTIILPKREETKPRRIPIDHA
jgi:HSP20 family protein